MYELSSKYFNYLLKIKKAEIFGTLPIHIKNYTNFVSFKTVISNSKNHHNNLIGKVCFKNNFKFYYIPFELIENYEINKIGIPICNDIYICPFCFGIQLSLEDQSKLYNLLNNIDNEINNNVEVNLEMNIYIRSKFCIDLLYCEKSKKIIKQNEEEILLSIVNN